MDETTDNSKIKPILGEAQFMPTANGYYILHEEGSNKYDRLTNFHCKVIKEIIYEGLKNTSTFIIWAGIPIEGSESTGYTYYTTRQLEVKSKDFHSGKWVQELGGEFILFPIQKYPFAYVNMIAQSWRRDIEIQKVSQVLGFKEQDSKLIFVSGNDIIGDASGIESIPLQGNPKLAKYGLKQTTNTPLSKSLVNSLEFLDLGTLKVTAPLYCAIWRAPLCYWKPFSGMIKLVGRTGSFKSSLAAKALSHYGIGFRDNTDLPLKWNNTPTALQIQLSILRDVLVVIDDFNPEFGKQVREQMGSTLSLILGDSGDGIAKQRANMDLTLRESLTIRNLIISTAEMLPNLPESRLARMLVVELSDINKVYRDKLFGYDPTLNTTITREYINWVRENPPTDLDSIYRKYKDQVSDKKTLFYERTMDLYANLMVGLVMFDKFLNAYGLKVEKELYDNVAKALYEICLDQNPMEEIAEDSKDYCKSFFEGVRTLIDEKRAYLEPISKGDSILGNDRKEFIGFYEEDTLYLSFYAAIHQVNEIRLKYNQPEIPIRVLSTDLKRYTETVSKLYKIDKNRVVRACKLSMGLIFPTSI